MRTCAVVPYFEHARTLAAVVEALLANELPCVVVDDGSGAAAHAAAATLAARHPGKVTLVTHPRNLGKGAAAARMHCRSTPTGSTTPRMCGRSCSRRRIIRTP